MGYYSIIIKMKSIGLIKLICIKSFKINQSKSHNFDFSIYLKAKKGIEFSISTELEHYPLFVGFTWGFGWKIR